MAQDDLSGWSFADHPHPQIVNLTQSELSALRKIRDKRLDRAENCRASIAANYDIYQNRYPAFRHIANGAARARHWRRHVVATAAPPYICVIKELGETRIAAVEAQLLRSPDFYFCGRYSRPPSSDAERRLVELVDELLAYAATGNLLALHAFPIYHDEDKRITLNPDVLYYTNGHKE